MTRYQHAGGAVSAKLAASISSSDSTIACDNLAGWPDGSVGPFFAVIARGTALEEKIRAAGRSTNTLTGVLRGQDGTAAVAHSNLDAIDHIFTALEADAANAHIEATTAVHGLTGALVGTTDTQTLTNKTLTTPTINGAALSGTLSGSPTLSGNPVFSGYPVVQAASGDSYLTVASSSAVGYVVVDGAGGSSSRVQFKSGGTVRWQIVRDSGAGLGFYRYNGSGTFVDTPLVLDGSGNITITAGTVNVTAVMNVNSAPVVTTTATQTLTNKTLTTPTIAQINNGSASLILNTVGAITVPGNISGDTLVGVATTQTLTNKTLNGATINSASTIGGVTGTVIAASLSGAWTAYTPSFTNVTGGAGDFAYKKIGDKTWLIRGTFTSGTVTSTGSVGVSLPAGLTSLPGGVAMCYGTGMAPSGATQAPSIWTLASTGTAILSYTSGNTGTSLGGYCGFTITVEGA